MKIENLMELIQAVSDSELTTFKYEEGETKITMRAGEPCCDVQTQGMPMMQQMPVMQPMQMAAPQPVAQTASAEAAPAATGEAAETPEAAPVGNIVESPLVGTFYTAPAEDADAFVKVGDTVKKGQTLAIVEAMKLMNEIECEFDGVVEEVLAENGQGVEYGQPLFRIK